MRRRRSLASFIGVGSLYLILVPLFFMGIWGSLIFTSAIRRSIASSNELGTRVVAGRLQEFLERQGQALTCIASMIERPELYPRSRMNAYLAASLSNYSSLDQIEVLDPEGRIAWMAPYDEAFAGVSRLGETVYESVKASKGIAWSASYISPRHNAPAVTFGELVDGYVILCNLNLSSVARFSAPPEPDAKYEISITDENGVYLAYPDIGKVRRREQQRGFPEIKKKASDKAGFEIEKEGSRFLVFAARMDAPPWFVTMLYPVSRVSAVLRGYYAGFLSILLLASVLGLAISRFRIRKVSAALEHLATKAARISEGKYDELVEFGEGFVEFERVGRKFNGMIAGIRGREETLMDRERGFRQILESIRLFAIGIGRDGRISFANPCLMEATGYSSQELVGSGIGALISCDPDSSPSRFERMIEDGVPESSVECRIIAKDGEARLVEWTVTANHDAMGAISGMTGIGTDITDRRRQSERLESSLAEKEILLKEVHHRVKNNMQLISSLLSLQKADAAGSAANLQLEEAQSRIRSISLVHEMLYGSEDFGSMDFGGYAGALAKEILQGCEGRGIELRQEIQAIGISLNEAIPCGLILNEALTNIRKHAFPPSWKGLPVVELSVARRDAKLAVLTVRDNGVGLPRGIDLASGTSLGLTIMRLLALQAGGALNIHSDNGTTVEMTFSAES
jgi:PAS domain S-box-containing protein